MTLIHTRVLVRHFIRKFIRFAGIFLILKICLDVTLEMATPEVDQHNISSYTSNPDELNYAEFSFCIYL